MGYFVASDTARDNLVFGLTVNIDSVNPMKLTRDWYRDVALTAGVPFLGFGVWGAAEQQTPLSGQFKWSLIY